MHINTVSQRMTRGEVRLSAARFSGATCRGNHLSDLPRVDRKILAWAEWRGLNCY